MCLFIVPEWRVGSGDPLPATHSPLPDFSVRATLVSRMLVRLLLLVLLAAAAPAQNASSVFEHVDAMVATLSEITGWKVHRKCPSEMLGKNSFRHFVESRM